MMKRLFLFFAAAVLLVSGANAEEYTYSDEDGTVSITYDYDTGTSGYTYQNYDDTSGGVYYFSDGSSLSYESDRYGTSTTYYDNTDGTFSTDYYSKDVDGYIPDGYDTDYGYASSWYGTGNRTNRQNSGNSSNRKRTSYYVSSSANATPYLTTSRSLRVRSGPGTDYSVLTSLPEGTTVYVTAISHGWASIVMNDGKVNACVSAKYLAPVRNGSVQTAPSTVRTEETGTNYYEGFKSVSYYAMVNPKNNYVNMRWEASKASEIRRVYFYGAELKVIAENDVWCQVYDETTGEVGFMMRSLLLPKEGTK